MPPAFARHGSETATELQVAPSAKPTANATADKAATLDQKLVREGYRPTMYHGQRVYCRDASPTGSNLRAKVCLTAEQIGQQEQIAREALTRGRADTTCGQIKCN